MTALENRPKLDLTAIAIGGTQDGRILPVHGSRRRSANQEVYRLELLSLPGKVRIERFFWILASMTIEEASIALLDGYRQPGARQPARRIPA